ncbi:MAG: phosphate/phosphite/phosphonate ABC transporter substrate-binding protein [Xanthomonadales bacterium]|nr:phosphate/phosphite/phosphonate ABC transporter substrate-binding protein [Xanthomonadales bacterium]
MAGLARCRRLLLLLIVGAGFLAAFPVAAQRDHEDILVLGRVSDDPKNHYAQLKPLLDYVVPRMHDVGIREGRILMARDVQQMTSYLRRGRVDWISETASSALTYVERGGGRMLVLTERSGVDHYHTVFFARRDAGIGSLDELRGHSIAFQNPFSTSAYVAPAYQILEAGLKLEVLLSPQDRPGTDSVGYVFAQSEGNVATWVHKGLADAGAFSNLDWDDLDRLPAHVKQDLAIFETGETYPRGVEVVRGDLPRVVSRRLREILLEASNDPDAAEPLAKFFRTTRFLPMNPDAEDGLRRLSIAARRVHEELE